MLQKAFAVLDAIHNRNDDVVAANCDWVEALKTIRWAVDTPDGPKLTEAGCAAHADMRGVRAWRRDTSVLQ